MAGALVTLTTDFGAGSPYVGAMKGALLAVNPAATIIDLSHSLPAQDLRHCSFFLRAACTYFPAGTLHVVVVDPGVGTERAILYVETGAQRLLVPDNGCWTSLASISSEPPCVVHLTERRYWRAEVSATFHGRDIFAPAAGHLSLGLDPTALGPRATRWAELPWPAARIGSDRLEGEVVFVDDFGNLLTNIASEDYQRCADGVHRIAVGGRVVDRRVRTYGEAPPGTVVALVSSVGTLEVAVVQGNAARRLGAAVGTPVCVELAPSPSQLNVSGT